MVKIKNLVEVKRGKVFCTSMCISKEFEISHNHVLEKIRNLTVDIPTVKNEFEEGFFKNERNREYPLYHITRRGYMSLIMNLEAKSKDSKMLLMQKKEMFIDAFEKMEQLLLKELTNKNNLEWTRSREQGKEIRLELTDTIKKFVEYATQQGSKNASKYYSNITRMEYKALGLMAEKIPKIRDTLNLMELNQLILAEDLIKRQFERYMRDSLHYKEIYILAKQDLDNFANALMLPKK